MSNAVTARAASPQEAARRLAEPMLARGYRAEALHEYRDANGAPVCWRIRLRHPKTREKWIRPMRRDGDAYTLAEPDFGAAGKPLYRLDALAADPRAPVWFVEGEWCADALARLGVLATTAGGATSDERADFAPLAGRAVTVWPDHDRAGIEHGERVAARLRALGCSVEIIDAAALGLAEGGDCVDWLRAHPGATAADLARLPRVREAAEGRVRAREAIPAPRAQKPVGRSRAAGASRNPSGAALAAVAPGDDRFVLDAEGVWYLERDREGNTRPQWVCSPLRVEALTEGDTTDGKGYLLVFADARGREKRWAMPARLLAGDGAEYRAALLDMGLRIGASPRARARLGEYIQTRRVETFVRCVERVGWHDGGVYVWPERTFGVAGEPVLFQAEERMRNPFSARGTLGEWRYEVAARCVGNSRLAFAVSAAFAAPCLALAGMEGGGFHLRGASSAGKTTALRVAASVYGGAEYVQTWRNTANALERVAEHYCDALLALDEIAQLDPAEAGDVAYLLVGGQAKARLTRAATLRARASWRVLFLSTGEVALADILIAARKSPRAGHEVRLVDLPADAGAGLGVFEALHGESGGAAFAERLAAAVRRYHGTAGAAFIEEIVVKRDKVAEALRERIGELCAEWAPHADTSGQVRRVAARFALVAAAGELATKWGITGWPDDESTRAAHALFAAWCEGRGGRLDAEDIAIVRHVAGVLAERGEANFPFWHRAADDHRPNSPNRWGYRKLLDRDGDAVESQSQYATRYGEGAIPMREAEGASAEYYVLAEPFRREVCKGYDPRYVAQVLLRRGHLVAGEADGEGGRRRYDRRERLPGIGPVRCYRIRPTIFADELL